MYNARMKRLLIETLIALGVLLTVGIVIDNSRTAQAQYTPPLPVPSAKICATVSLTAQSATVGPTNLLCDGAQAKEGMYRIFLAANTTSGQNGSGNIAPTMTWATAGLSLSQPLSATTMSLVATSSGVSPAPNSVTASGGRVFHHDGSAHITYTITYTSTGKYDVYICLEKLI